MDQSPANRRRQGQAYFERRLPAHNRYRKRRINGEDAAEARAWNDLSHISPRDMNRLQRRSRVMAVELADADVALAPQSPLSSRRRDRPANSASRSRDNSAAQRLLAAIAQASEDDITAGAPLTNPSAEVQAVETQAPQSPPSKSGKEQASKEKK